MRDQGSRQATEKAVRQLKTEQGRRLSSSVVEQDEAPTRSNYSSQKPQRTISRGNFFKRS
jgi:hypothetical protein